MFRKGVDLLALGLRFATSSLVAWGNRRLPSYFQRQGHSVSSLLLPEQSKLLVNGVTISLLRANPDDAIHCESVGRELRRVITNDAKEHGVEYDGRNFAKVLAAYRHNRIQAYFLIVDRECCEPIKDSPTPLYAGGAVQFPTVITEWNGHSFEHFHAIFVKNATKNPKTIYYIVIINYIWYYTYNGMTFDK